MWPRLNQFSNIGKFVVCIDDVVLVLGCWYWKLKLIYKLSGMQVLYIGLGRAPAFENVNGQKQVE